MNGQDLAGFTPLMWAAGRDSADGVKMLLDCEARRVDAVCDHAGDATHYDRITVHSTNSFKPQNCHSASQIFVLRVAQG